jgi:hypothetical protein
MKSFYPSHEGTSLLPGGSTPDVKSRRITPFAVLLFAFGLFLGMMFGGVFRGPPPKVDILVDAREGKFRRTQFFGFGVNTGGSDSSVQCSNRTGVGWFGDSLEVRRGDVAELWRLGIYRA